MFAPTTGAVEVTTVVTENEDGTVTEEISEVTEEIEQTSDVIITEVDGIVTETVVNQNIETTDEIVEVVTEITEVATDNGDTVQQITDAVRISDAVRIPVDKRVELLGTPVGSLNESYDLCDTSNEALEDTLIEEETPKPGECVEFYEGKTMERLESLDDRASFSYDLQITPANE